MQGGFRLVCLHKPNNDSILLVVCEAIHEAYTSLSPTQENTHKFILFWIPSKPNQGLYHVHSSITPLENLF